MLNSILETRNVENGLYRITLRINEEEYFNIYNTIDEADALEILKNYLEYKADDGRPVDIKLQHNKNQHLVTIDADLHYADNEKTESMYHTHDYIHKD